MADLSILLEKLKIIKAQKKNDDDFFQATGLIARFFEETFNVDEDEVAILLTDKEKVFLSFAHPPYLINSGVISVSSPDAFAAYVYKNEQAYIENNFFQQKHLHLFEFVKPPAQKPRPIWKIMAAVLVDPAKNDKQKKYGVVEISRKGTKFEEAGPDFSVEDLEILKNALNFIAPIYAAIIPENFKGRILER